MEILRQTQDDTKADRDNKGGCEMGNYYLKTVTVPIPFEDKLVVIRKGVRVEYEIDRIYLPEEQNTRVKRKVIGKVDPVQPGRMFPNEFYFELFPENEVPEEVREEFLRACAIKRQMSVIRKNPEEVVDNVMRGLEQMRNYTSSGLRPPSPQGEGYVDGLRPPAWAAARSSTENEHTGSFSGRFEPPQGEGYVMLRRVFDEIYYAIEDLAGKFPNEVIVPFKVERINEILEELRGLSNTPSDLNSVNKHLRLIEEGLTYSDVLLLLKWYKVLPR